MQFAIPSVLSMLIDALYNVADQIFIGQGVGYLGIAATTVTFPFATILLAIATLLGIGGSVYTSMSMGAGKNEEAEKTLGAVVTLSVAIGTLFTAIGLIFLEPLVLTFGATEGVQGSLPFSIMELTSSAGLKGPSKKRLALQRWFLCLDGWAASCFRRRYCGFLE